MTLNIYFVNSEEGKKIMVDIENAYNVKEELKKDGFAFNGSEKTWEKLFDLDKGTEMMMYVKQIVGKFGIRNLHAASDVNKYLMETVKM